MNAWLRAGVAALLGLVALQVAWHGIVDAPRGAARWFVLAVAVGPLVPALAVLRAAPRRGLLLGGIVGLFYFAHGVMEAWATPSVRWLGLAEAALVTALVAALGGDAIVAKRARRAAKG